MMKMKIMKIKNINNNLKTTMVKIKFYLKN